MIGDVSRAIDRSSSITRVVSTGVDGDDGKVLGSLRMRRASRQILAS